MIAALGWSWPVSLRAAVPITKPKDYVEPPEAGPQLPPEGSMVINVRCHVERDRESGWQVVVFEKEPGSSSRLPRWALPCRLLETMEQVTRSKPDAIFRISGENTIYDGRCFILVQKAVLELEPPPAEPKVPVTSRGAVSRPAEPTTTPTSTAAKPAVTTGPTIAQTAPGAKPAATGPAAATAPATMPIAPGLLAGSTSDDLLAALRKDRLGKGPVAGDAPSEPAASDDILRALRRDRLGKPIVPVVRPKTGPPNEPSVAPVPKGKVLSPGRGWAVVDRLVTVMPAGRGQWMQVRFESDNTLREPPMRLLPCGMLRKAELLAAAAEKGKTVRLRISGVITFYRGKRFLLLRKALLERDLGRF